MNLEPNIQCKVSQKKKDKYGMLTHIDGIQKDSIDDLLVGQQKRQAFWTQLGKERVG